MQILFDGRVIVFDTLSEAQASTRHCAYEEVLLVAGDNTKFKRGDGLLYDSSSQKGGSTWSQLPYYNSTNVGGNTPLNSFAVPATATLTAAQLLNKYITSTSAAAVSITLPTATLLGTAVGAVQGTEFDFTVDNTAGANTVTLVVGTGITAATPALTGGANLAVANGFVGKFKIFFTSATTALIYRSL